MGHKAKQLFDEANSLGGLAAKIRLAVLTRVTSGEAETVQDTPEVLERVSRAMATIRSEFGNRPQAAKGVGQIAAPAVGSGDVAVLRRHVDVFLELMGQRSLFLGDVTTTVQRVTESAAIAIDTERVSVWFTDEAIGKITCADLFERTPGKHSAGLVLSAHDFAPYFNALREQRTIAAHDAHTDPRTSCFSTSYLGPLGIGALLDVPIWVDQKMVGVVCHEHVGPARRWTMDEERFGYLMSNFVALALEQRKARR